MLHAQSRRAFPRVITAACLALAGGLASFALSPAVAAAPSKAGYSVALASPLAAPAKQILNGVLWRCDGDACTGAADGSRPVLACTRVAQTFGPVARFTGPRGDLSADDLARCNAQ